ncbi:hypothetical protein TH63_06395 [Rufibacter radiotolerans]|uniref:Uncharacterized protein n=1 Tax=Rufibacter radiotolerans TaxID=1379910 RepID=A0A0H4VNN4_9BACT|nr:hypothetical protein [Rufibacter radiotolerans]AKQ45349.1 hypothetical protein TH63_06395 [Rufibacter radiotolerans]
MGTFPFDLSAQLVLTVQEDHVLVVAEENYVIINFQDHLALERVLENLLPASSGKSSGGLVQSLEKSKELNQVILNLGLVVDIRVNNKTYIQFGVSSSPKISANAVLGKVGSWFKKS